MMSDKTFDQDNPAPVLVAFTCAKSWRNVLPLLRIVGPCNHAGCRLIRGNEGEEIAVEAIALADLVLMQRDFSRDTDSYQMVMARARKENKPVVVDMDDLLFQLPFDHPDRPGRYFSEALIPMVRSVMEADAVTVSSRPLEEIIRLFNPNIYVLPNFLDDQLWPLQYPKLKSDSDRVVLGYFGTHTHLPDLEMVTPVLSGLLDRYAEKLLIKIWCPLLPEDLQDRPGVEWIRLDLEYPDFVDRLSDEEIDLAIAPLLENPFNDCKSHLKFLEYSALGIPGVYSLVGPYQSVVRSGENGFLSSNLMEWEMNLRNLIEKPQLRQFIGRRALQTLQEDWLLSRNAFRWMEVYHQVIQGGGSKSRPFFYLDLLNEVLDVQKEAKRVELEEMKEVYLSHISEKDRIFQTLKEDLHGLQEELSGAHGQLLNQERQITALSETVEILSKNFLFRWFHWFKNTFLQIQHNDTHRD
jgi:glycosyltransferase involved in cell wall biosynthesis